MTDDLGNFDSEMKRVERLSALQRHAEAVALLNDIVSQYPGRFEPYFQRAMSKHSSGDPTGALADLTDAIALNPNEPASFFFRGRWQVERGATEDGIMDLRRAIVADEAHGSSYYADSARLSIAVAYFLARQFRESSLACEGLSSNVTTYFVGRLWTIADLRR